MDDVYTYGMNATQTIPASLLIMLTSLMWTACGSVQSRPRAGSYVDQMHFVDDDAVERVVAPRKPRRRERSQRHATANVAPRCANRKSGKSLSIGRATDGELQNGCELPRRGTGYVRKNRDGWGTDTTIRLLQWAFAEMTRQYPRTVATVVGAISRRYGGQLTRHRSHQNGRDVDIGYLASNNIALPHFRKMGPRNLDPAKNWALINALLSTGQVQYIFMDYNLQAMLYRHLEDVGTRQTTLRRVFQYPAGRAVRRGVIRHAGGHQDHFHVRFRCAPTDGDECVN